MWSIAIPFAAWSVMWVVMIFFTEAAGIDAPANPVILLVLKVFHWSSLLPLTYFFATSIKGFRQIRLDTFERQIFVAVGSVAAFANVGVNYYSPTTGVDHHPTLFIACTIHNTMMYVGLVLVIMIYDGWDMSKAKTSDRICVWVFVIAQIVIITALVVSEFCLLCSA